jgi:hypothetical protein
MLKSEGESWIGSWSSWQFFGEREILQVFMLVFFKKKIKKKSLQLDPHVNPGKCWL